MLIELYGYLAFSTKKKLYTDTDDYWYDIEINELILKATTPDSHLSCSGQMGQLMGWVSGQDQGSIQTCILPGITHSVATTRQSAMATE